MDAHQPTPFDLNQVNVRLIRAEERTEWDRLMREHHYLGLTAMVGRSLRYIAEVEGRWLALLGWASPALKCASRDAWIGWSPTLQWQRLNLIANNSRFLILPGARIPNLASRILGLNLARLSADWQTTHGHGLLLAETFVDPSRFKGTCYRAANWIELGSTRGFAKSSRIYVAHGVVKRIWVFPLHRKAQEILSQRSPHPQLPSLEIKTMQLSAANAASLFANLAKVDDPRAKRGRRHSQRSLLACIMCATISGAQGATAIAEWVQRLTPTLRQRLRCRRLDDGSHEVPSEPTIRRLLGRIDVKQLERQLGSWLQSMLPNDTTQNSKARALDGKVLRGSYDHKSEATARQLVSVINHQHGAVLHQVEIAEKASELHAVEPLLEPLDLKGCIVTADALHTQVQTARYLVDKKQADYVLTVKDNQPHLKAAIEASLPTQAIPPCARHS